MDVLVVEDENALRESLVEGLAKALPDMSVAGAPSAEEATPLLDSEPPRLIISDVRLPGKDGVALLLDVRSRWPTTAFIFMSAYPAPEARERATERGVQFLCKPFEFAELIEAVESVLDRNQFSGELGGISLVDLLQVLNMGRRTAAVTLKRRGEEGRIFLADGEIVHAAVGELTGREAFDSLMAWRGGSFGSEPGRQPPARTISEPFNGLLLDCLRIQDEQAESAADDDFVADLFESEIAEATPEQEADSLPRLLERAYRGIPGCVSTGCVDIGSGTLVGLVPEGAVPDPVAALIPTAARALVRHPALRELDATLCRNDDGAELPDAPRVREVIVLSGDLIHHFQIERASEARIFVTVCRSRNLGTVVAKAREWLRAATRSGPGA